MVGASIPLPRNIFNHCNIGRKSKVEGLRSQKRSQVHKFTGSETGGRSETNVKDEGVLMNGYDPGIGALYESAFFDVHPKFPSITVECKSGFCGLKFDERMNLWLSFEQRI
jgi:hypothetical protein